MDHLREWRSGHASGLVYPRWWERPLLAWLTYWHGRGAPTQDAYYRCANCHRLVTWHRIKTDGGCRCGGARLRATRLTWLEKARVLGLPWTL
jgi:hypothetical protein